LLLRQSMMVDESFSSKVKPDDKFVVETELTMFYSLSISCFYAIERIRCHTNLQLSVSEQVVHAGYSDISSYLTVVICDG
ncbi:Hypothetical predicted protein, partial [Paramuricea clavata]